MEPYNNGGEKHTKRLVDLLHTEIFGLNGIWETLKRDSAFNRFWRETSNKSLNRIRFFGNCFRLLNEPTQQRYQ